MRQPVGLRVRLDRNACASRDRMMQSDSMGRLSRRDLLTFVGSVRGWATRLTVRNKDNTMATKTASKPSQDNDTQGASVGELTGAAQDVAQATANRVESELKALADAHKAFATAAKNIGPLGMEILAKNTGLSVTSTGRPTWAAHAPFVAVLIHYRDAKGERMGFKQRNRLYDIALKAVGSMAGEEGHYTPKNGEELTKAKERFVKAKGKASDDGAQCALRMSRPAAEEIALGE